MPKKTPRNAFFFYMLDVKRREELAGRHFAGGLAEVSALAGPQWQQMSPAERAPFDKQAKRSRHDRHDDETGDLLTAQGVPYAQVERARQLVLDAEAQMRRDIDDMVQRSYKNNTIAEQPYYFIASNHFCRTAAGHSRFYPAELAVLRFALATGYTRRFHTFCNPGALPAGYAFEAQEHAHAVHGLPTPPAARGQSDYRRLWADIRAFIDETGDAADADADDPSRPLPPLFTDVRQLPAVRSIVAQLCEAAGRDARSVRVYPLCRLFHVLKREALRYGLDELDGGFASEHVAQALLDRDPYDQRDEIACEFHREADRSRHCALSLVTRYAFMLADHICMDLGIDLVLGRHVPADSDVTAALLQRTEMVAVRQFASARDIGTTVGAASAAAAAEADEEDNDDGHDDDGEDGEDGGAESETDNTKYDLNDVSVCADVAVAAAATTFGEAGRSARADPNYTQYAHDQSAISLTPSALSASNLWLRGDWPKPRPPADSTFEVALQRAKRFQTTATSTTTATANSTTMNESLDVNNNWAADATFNTSIASGSTLARILAMKRGGDETRTTTLDESTASAAAAAAAAESTLNASSASDATIARMLANKMKIGWGRGRLA